MKKNPQKEHEMKDEAGSAGDRTVGGDCPVIVVGIGTSESGLKSLKQILTRMPLGHGVAFVLIGHPRFPHENPIVRQLKDETAFSVVEAEEGMPVLADRIHIMPANKYLNISGSMLTLHEPIQCNGLWMPIDHFFCSLAVDQKFRGCGILLSGDSSDGVMGLSEIKTMGGRTMAEDPATAELPDLPQSAVDAGVVDMVLPADAIVDAIVALAGQVTAETRSRPAEAPEFDAGLRAILEILRVRVGHDFHCYKPNTLVRRIRRRMSLGKVDGFSEYARFLEEHPEEIPLLHKDLLIGVTEFFRQPDAWKALRDKVISRLVDQVEEGSEIRAWVPGCSTGQEVYSLAMVLTGKIEASGKKVGIRIFATDTDDAALITARAGSYPEEDIEKNIPSELRRRFFVHRGGRYQVIKEIRQQIVFAPQNLTADPPFSRINLIICRNLLIYLDPQVQRKIIALFHFALAEGGFLFLGNAESVGDREDLFEPASKKWRIYRRIGVGRPVDVEIPVRPRGAPLPAFARTPAQASSPRVSLTSVAQQMLLDRFAPACVMIDRKLQVLYVHGKVEDYLTYPPGEMSTRVVDMAREGLRARLRGAIAKCIEMNRRMTITARVRRREKSVPVRTTVSPLQYPREADGLLLVTFEDYRAPASTTRKRAGGENDFTQLQDELKVTREELQSTIEQLEISNDQLKASNEEVTAANEELQSANEELETSKEELQSLNEELNTINARLQEKVAELEEANNDVVNLLSSTSIATVFLDKELRVRRYTPAITTLLSLIPSDIGRPIADILRRFTDEALSKDAAKVLADLTPVSREVPAEDGRWYIRRITPYRTQDDRIEGVALTFVDITVQKQGEEALREAKDHLEIRVWQRTSELEHANLTLKEEIKERRRAEEAVKAEQKRFNDVLEILPAYLVLLTPDYYVPFANRFFRERFGESHGKRCFEYLFGRAEPCETCETYTVLKTMTPHEWEWNGPDGRIYYVYDFPFIDTDGSTLIMETGIDITDLKQAEAELLRHKEHLEEMVRERTAELNTKNAELAAEIAERERTAEALGRAKEDWERTFASVPDMIAILDDQHRVLRTNPAMARRLGCTPDECVGMSCYSVVHGTDAPPAFCPHSKTLATGREYTTEVHEDRLGGDFLVSTTPIFNEQGRMMGSVHVARDITERKLAEKALQEREEDLNRAQAVAHIGSWRLGIQKDELIWSDETHRIFGIPRGTPLTYETFLGTVHPDDRAYVDQKWQASLLGQPYDIEHRIVVADKVRWVREQAELELDKDGKLLGGFGVAQDITEKKQSEEALRNSQTRFMLLSSTAGQLLTTRDPQGIVNELCRQIMTHLDCHVFFNFLVDENAGRLRLNTCAGIPEDEVQKLKWLDYGVAVCGCVARDGEPIIAEDIFHNLDPLTELVQSFGVQAYACNPLKFQDQLIGTLSFGTRTRAHFSPDDLALMKTVTDHVATAMARMRLVEELRHSRDKMEIRVEERTAELKELNKALEQSNRDLEDFAYVSSHDLQEPLRKIQTFSDRLITGYRESLDDNARFFLQRMQSAAGRMQDLILDVLKYSRIRSRPEPFVVVNLTDPVMESISDLKILQEETQAQILIDELPVIEADPVQMRQLFQNLLTNALKYRGKEPPIVRVSSIQHDPDGFCEIHIEDNGIGFEEHYLDRIFKPFQRLHGQNSHYHGTGMGLAICRRIVERHGGTITAKSQPDKGSTFIVKLPLRQKSGH